MGSTSNLGAMVPAACTEALLLSQADPIPRTPAKARMHALLLSSGFILFYPSSFLPHALCASIHDLADKLSFVPAMRFILTLLAAGLISNLGAHDIPNDVTVQAF